MTNGAFARVQFDALLAAQGWNTRDPNAVRYEVASHDSTRADYVLCDQHGRSLAVIEASRFSVSADDAATQAQAYAQHLWVPYVIPFNGTAVRFRDWQRAASPRSVKTFLKQDDLERRAASCALCRELAQVPIDPRIVERDFRIACIDTPCDEIRNGRCKLLVQMATGTGKTRIAAVCIKHLFEANAVKCVLFLVDCVQLAKQTEEAFVDHLPDYARVMLSSESGRQTLLRTGKTSVGFSTITRGTSTTHS